MKKEKILISLLVILNLFIISSIVFIFNKNDSKRNNQYSKEEVLGEQISLQESQPEKEYYDINICCEKTCMKISKNRTKEFFTQQELDKGKVMEYTLEEVYPFFENNFGKKIEVKNRNGSFITWKDDKRPALSNIYKDILFALEEISPEPIIIKMKDLPGTDGTYSKKYIEIDNSKQKLYYWYKGSVERIVKLSGPKYGFQVYGVFPIIDKGVAPIAPSGNYMPYWMAFFYSPRQDSWYGLHALIWHYDENGKRVFESLENIGQRKSAGCIRMLLEDAKYLYSKMDKGDRVLIHE